MSKKILVTGANGFIGKNLVWNLRNAGYDDIYLYTHTSSDEDLDKFTKDCDFVFHLAGVNRPKETSEFFDGNTQLTQKIVSFLEKNTAIFYQPMSW